MTPELDPKTLRTVAEQATPGPWEMREESPSMDGRNFTLRVQDKAGIRMSAHCYGFNGDPEFIATFDPPTVLALLTQLEQAKQDLHWEILARQELKNHHDELQENHKKSEAQVARVREQRDKWDDADYRHWIVAPAAVIALDYALDGEPNE